MSDTLHCQRNNENRSLTPCHTTHNSLFQQQSYNELKIYIDLTIQFEPYVIRIEHNIVINVFCMQLANYSGRLTVWQEQDSVTRVRRLTLTATGQTRDNFSMSVTQLNWVANFMRNFVLRLQFQLLANGFVNYSTTHFSFTSNVM